MTPSAAAAKLARSLNVGALYRGHHDWLFAWLRRKLGCVHQAADLTHDTFLRLLAARELPALDQPRAYLLVTANHLLINQYHRRRVEAETLRTVAIIAADATARQPDEIEAARQLLRRVLLLLTHELDDKPRRAFLMARVDGLSYREIARRLRVSESSVKQYLAKVMVHCHARLSASVEDANG